MRTADISGTQRKVVDHSVRPSRLSEGSVGIPVKNGTTRPFVVERSWSAPLGVYEETFYLIDPKTREVLFEGPVVERDVLGLQAMTVVTEEVAEPIALKPGTYGVVFALGGVMGGEFEVEAFEIGSEEAA
ncbi:MAG: hypothetical protein ACLGHL_04710 [Actinomycetota bacterium]